ncbi:hypothetical protein ZIOFF_064762 [Zingiber officinale]|uniref:Uncharacterized protein n=1 Tax=Zingiber officinale TaxID=94328 RepID=A0A8J5EWE2_ZINOF|nr:hypothetical protein ZIOFF_064762 [Zingiber officinale]
MVSGLGLEETELRLGLELPGGGKGEGTNKRGLEETIDLKLQMPSDVGESEVALESFDNMVKKRPNPMNIASWSNGGGVHPEKPSVPNYA